MFEPAKKHPVSPISTVRECAGPYLAPAAFAKVVVFLMALAVGAGGFSGQAFCGENQTLVFERAELTIESAGGLHHFRIEVANTPATHRQGLMNRAHMDENAGMLFDFGKPRQVNMWMKNTIISLDMLFIDRFGVIVKVAPNTTPFSTATVASPGPILAVLELNAGTASRLEIMPGDKINHQIFLSF